MTASSLLLFAAVALVSALSPGPNMVYLVSRTLCQGRGAGLVSLLGVVSGMAVYLVLTSCGLAAVFLAVPYAYDGLRLAGAAYLLHLAWIALRRPKPTPFQIQRLPKESRARLYTTGLLTSLFNPKLMVFYCSILPQFMAPEQGSTLVQGLLLGCTQIAVAFSAHLCVILAAGRLAGTLARRPRWIAVQRYFLGSIFAALAIRLALERRPGA